MNEKWLTSDNLINAGQKMLKLQFEDMIQGLQYVHLAQTFAMDVQLGILSCTLQWNWPSSMHLWSGRNATTFFQLRNAFQSTDPFSNSQTVEGKSKAQGIKLKEISFTAIATFLTSQMSQWFSVVTVKSGTTTHVRRFRRNAGTVKPSGIAIFVIQLSCTLACILPLCTTTHFHFPC